MSVSRGGIDSRTSRLLRRSVRKICSGGADGCSALAFDPPGCAHSVACPADQSVSAHDAQPSPSSSLLAGSVGVPVRRDQPQQTARSRPDRNPGPSGHQDRALDEPSPRRLCDLHRAVSTVSRIWAALPYAGRDAAASPRTALWLWKLVDDPPKVIDVVVPENRKVLAQQHLRVHCVAA